MGVRDYILNNMGNDARSADSAERLISFARDGSNFSNMPELVRSLEMDRKTPKRTSMLFKVLKHTSFIFIFALLPFYYLLTALGFLPFFIIGVFSGKDYEESVDRESWDLLFQYWSKYPNSFIIKAIEAFYFRSESVDSPSLEIGVYRGNTSRAVFHKKSLNAGMEFVPKHLFNYASGVSFAHERLLSGDIYDIPFENNTFSSVFVIHSFDDIQRGIEGALNECSRVILPGGKLVFSTYSGYFGKHNFLLRLLEFLRLRKLEGLFFRSIYIGTNNIFDKSKWCSLLEGNGFNVERFIYFIPMSAAMLIDIPFRLEGYLMNLFSFHDAFFIFTRKYSAPLFKKMLMKTLRGVWFVSQRNKNYEKSGINIFVVARKKNDFGSNSGQREVKFDFDNSLICPVCKAEVMASSDEAETLSGSIVGTIVCKGCKKNYVSVSKIPILLKTASFCWKDKQMIEFS
ncbi:MAG: hypothetical protein COV73_04905 [Candidatus Omnitrophica bacterium CG11_big_fil_rev_8_21_14_0_20_43_6]|nr:MAG: hypothetical protein COV73_04905 [Candidatus Omnitrophica bacterium CG11_big_fil_rev_8_21_14_0_20_43_6]